MITRDYILRQIHQMAQVLAQVVFHRRARSYEEARAILNTALEDVPGLDLSRLRSADRQALIAFFDGNAAEATGLLSSAAELLYEDGLVFAGQQQSEEACASLERSLWLYDEAIARREPVPHDVHDRMSRINEILSFERLSD